MKNEWLSTFKILSCSRISHSIIIIYYSFENPFKLNSICARLCVCERVRKMNFPYQNPINQIQSFQFQQIKINPCDIRPGWQLRLFKTFSFRFYARFFDNIRINIKSSSIRRTSNAYAHTMPRMDDFFHAFPECMTETNKATLQWNK